MRVTFHFHAVKHISYVAACLAVLSPVAGLPQTSQQQTQPQQSPEKNPEQKSGNADGGKGGFEILSDTMGVDFRAYVEQIRSKIYPAWLRAIPDVARGPEKKQGTALFEFNILKDGRIADLKLTQSSGDKSMDLAPQMALVSAAPLPQLPVAFRGDYLKIRCRFIYNPGAHSAQAGQKK